MNKKFSFRRVLLAVVLAALVISGVGIAVMSISKYKLNADVFVDDGYMLLATNDKTSESINEQHYFNAGENYRKTIDNTIVFTDVNGVKVSAEKENFVHYQSGSMNGLAESVVLDADHVDPNEQVSYYSVPEKTTLNKNGTQYTLNNAGNNINFTNFLWKISNDRYMVVSPTIDLVISDSSEQNFTDYVELRYIDEGIVHLVTQDGTYSTVSSDAYLQLSNGIRIYIGSKNISNGETILMNMSQMVVGSDDNIEVIPDEDYTIENEEKPQIVINATDGEDGKTGEEGEIGEKGNSGTSGDNGQSGVNGSNAESGSSGLTGASGRDGDSGTIGETPDYDPEQLRGEDGKTGKAGENGENGENGKPGQRGNSGATGNPGESAPNSDVIFEPEVLPQFTDITLDTLPYGVIENMKYNSNGCSVSDAWVSIVDVSTGNEVWKKNIKSLLPADNMPVSKIECDTLHANTQYRFNIHATYTSPNYPTQKLSQVIGQELFYTDSYGYTLTKKAITYNSLELNVNKDKDSLVKYLRVKIYDENGVDYGYAVPIDSSTHPVDSTYSFEVDESLAIGDSIPVKISGLTSNTIYYAQIQIMSLSGEEGSVPTIVPTNSYPRQKYLTKKLDPILSKPTANVDEVTKMFVITPGTVVDTDNGVTGYRLEIYEANTYGDEGSKPYYVHNIETPLLTNISVPLTDDVQDKTKLQRNVEYCAHIVAIFNDNEETIDFRSPVSDNFIAGEGKWPSASFEFISDYITASTIEGRIIITDTSTHAFPENSLITIEYMINETTSDDIKHKKGTVTEFKEKAIPISQFTHDSGSFEYSYPISLKSLKENTEYKLILKSSEFYIDGIRHGSPTTFETFANTSVSTKEKYSPLLLEAYDIRDKKTDYTTSMFAISLQFTPIDIDQERALREYKNSIVPNLGNMGDVSARSLTYLALDLYVGVGENPDRPVTKLTNNPVIIKDCNNFIKDGVHPKYGESTEGYTPIYDERNYGYSYAFNTSIFEDAYCDVFGEDQKTTSGKNLGLILTDDIFTDGTGYNPIRDTDRFKQGTQFFIKVTAYDYTYGLGSGYNINGDSHNKIKIGDKLNDDQYEHGSNRDSWISFYSSYAVPAVPQTYPYCNNYLALGLGSNNAKANLKIDSTYYENPSDTKIDNIHLSNLQNMDKEETDLRTNKEILESLWSEQGIDDRTDVGITYRGPSVGKDSLAQYCSPVVPSVCYNLYKLIYNETEMKYEEYPVASSGFMKYMYSPSAPNNLMPEYTFFYDIVDKDYKDKESGGVISRGDKYIIETQLILRGNETHTIEEGGIEKEVPSIYPNYWHEELHKLPGDDGTIRTYRVYDELRSNRQVPTILSMPYKANVNNDEADEIYLIAKDPDLALVTDTPRLNPYETIKVFKGDRTEEDAEELFGIVDEIRNVTDTDKVLVVKGNALEVGNLYSKYSLNEENDRESEYSYIDLISEEKITKAKTITRINTKTVADTGISTPTEGKIVINDDTFKDFTYKFENGFINIDFKYQTVNPKEKDVYNELLGADVIFNKYVNEEDCTEDDCELVPAIDSKTGNNITETIFVVPTYDDVIEEVYEGITTYTYKSKIKIDSIDIANIIDGSDGVGITLSLYYDSGDYGIEYFDSDSSIVDKTSNYYLIQKANSNGKAIIPSSKYPNGYYETTKKVGISSIDDTNLKEISTPLFNRDEVTYKLNENKISSGNKEFTIKNVGLENSIIKNVGSSVSDELVTHIAFIPPKAAPIKVTSGYSTAIMDFKVFSIKTVLQDNSDILIQYKKQGDSSYKTIKVHYDAAKATIDENDDGIFEGIIIGGLEHSSGSTPTQYEYIISGYPKGTNPETDSPVVMYSDGKFKVQYFEHLPGNVKVETYKDGSSKTRDSKQLNYTLSFENIITKDIDDSLGKVIVQVFDENPETSASVHVPVSTKEVNISEIFDVTKTGEEYNVPFYPSQSYNVKIPWEPSDKKIHEMASDKRYWIKVEYDYKRLDHEHTANFDVPRVEEYLSLGEDSSSSITGWNEFYNLKSYVLQGNKWLETDDSHSDYQLVFDIAGKDKDRLQSIASDNKLTFLLELCDADGNVVEINNEYQRKLLKGVNIGNDGAFSIKGLKTDKDGKTYVNDARLQFKNLKPNTLYHLNAYFVLDGQNIDEKEIIGFLNLTDDNIKTNPTVVNPDKIITKGTGVYKIQSIDVRTGSDSLLRVDSAILRPQKESQEALIIGTNLNFVQRIQYVVNKNGVDLTPIKQLTDTELRNVFRKDEYSSELYYLDMPEFAKDGDYDKATYIVRIDFYGDSGDDWSNPSVTAQGIWGIGE